MKQYEGFKVVSVDEDGSLHSASWVKGCTLTGARLRYRLHKPTTRHRKCGALAVLKDYNSAAYYIRHITSDTGKYRIYKCFYTKSKIKHMSILGYNYTFEQLSPSVNPAACDYAATVTITKKVCDND